MPVLPVSVPDKTGHAIPECLVLVAFRNRNKKPAQLPIIRRPGGQYATHDLNCTLRVTAFAVCLKERRNLLAFRYNASFGHTFTHSKHKIHSVPFLRFLEVSVTSTSIGHAFLHFPQEMHLFVSHFIRIREK